MPISLRRHGVRRAFGPAGRRVQRAIAGADLRSLALVIGCTTDVAYDPVPSASVFRDNRRPPAIRRYAERLAAGQS